ncbi:phosphatidylcholine transfer protein [Mortierella sp. GBAus27b]|nr:phosphatidylcholine transfer protein [Mortierella sp. GBAus27b]
MFTEDQINEAIVEMKQPDVRSWELFSEVPNFRVYRRPVPNSSLKEYKVLGTYPDLPSRYLVRAYTDYEFRKTWDSNMIGWKALANERLHFVAKFPWPLSPRDYVYEQRVKEYEDGVIAVHGKSVQDESAPERSGVVRVDEFRQDVVIQPTEDGQGCNVWFGYYDNPKGNIPSSIINWAAKSGIPGKQTGMLDACGE